MPPWEAEKCPLPKTEGEARPVTYVDTVSEVAMHNLTRGPASNPAADLLHGPDVRAAARFR